MQRAPPIAIQDDQALPVARFRKRTRRACDKCSTSRVRCDGECPCRRCQEYGHLCQYERDVRKRGRKRAAHHDGTEAVERESHGDSPDDISPNSLVNEDHHQMQAEPLPNGRVLHQVPPDQGGNENPAPADAYLQPPPESRTVAALPQPQRTTSFGSNPDARRQSDYTSEPSPTVSRLSRPSITLPAFASHFGQDIAGFSPRAAPPGIGSDPAPAGRHGRTSYSGTAQFSSQAQPHAPLTPTFPQQRPGESYKCLEPVLPLLQGIIEADVANELLEFYFAKPGSSLFRVASPYVLTHVIRKTSLLRPVQPRETTPALLMTILWVGAQTADLPVLALPGSRTKICEQLRRLATLLLQRRDHDHWHRLPGGRMEEDDIHHSINGGFDGAHHYQHDPPPASLDDLLAFILFTIVVSGGDFKTDCSTWWSKAVRLSQTFSLNREDGVCQGSGTACSKAMCTCRMTSEASLTFLEAKEERRRVFWLLFCLDRHLALSFNNMLNICDDECEVYTPLPDEVWENLESVPYDVLTRRTFGPPTLVTGTGFFEYFLPLMTTMGDVIQRHHLKLHPRLGTLNDSATVSLLEAALDSCSRSIADLSTRYDIDRLDSAIPASEVLTPSPVYKDNALPTVVASATAAPTATGGTGVPAPSTAPAPGPSATAAGAPPTAPTGAPPPPPPPLDPLPSLRRCKSRAQAQLVTAYSTFILHVLHVLLHGKWDAVSMLENDDGWITSVEFIKCASHAIAASEAVSKILTCDPELTFMPYLFGIYLLHGSFILLLFADRMPQLGPNESVERACETIIRAHEVCVVTLNTEFQKQFRKVLRSTLYSVRSAGATNVEESRARRRALSLYRWTKGSRGLAL